MTDSHNELSPPVLSFPRREQQRPGPDLPKYAIPREQWPIVLRRVEQGDSYRQIARDYHTSYESIRRVVRAMRRQQEGGQA